MNVLGIRRLNKKVALIAGATGAVVFTGIYGFAASLNLTTSTLGAASTTVAACQAGTLTATYAPTYSATIPGYQAGVITIGGLTSTCYSMPYKITLSGAGGTSLGEVTGTTPNTGTSFNTTAETSSAASVTAINLVING